MILHTKKRNPPNYYEKVENIAKRRWGQLESDPGLAGPWCQLFAQIQSRAFVKCCGSDLSILSKFYPLRAS